MCLEIRKPLRVPTLLEGRYHHGGERQDPGLIKNQIKKEPGSG